ncbi:MAG: hypothetical protein BWY71_00164 [Planctomycetes bacterium ADurb.Bin412]|nr:MAG: hypothetical protein BWY71_00164 [Planctomycetes bacterium ADurb.Bin412]
MKLRPLKTGKTAWIFAICLVPVALGGCNMLGAFYGIFIDPLVPAPKVEAEHEFGSQKVLIWIDDISNHERGPILHREIIENTQRELRENLKDFQTVAYDDIVRFRRQFPDYPSLNIQEIGQKLQAEQVLYIYIDSFQLQHAAGEGYYLASLNGHLNVIEVETGKRLWPKDHLFRPLSQTGQLEQGQGDLLEDKLVRQLSRQIAQQIAPYFYNHRLEKQS